MIELLLQGERALSVGLLDQAERLYRQAADADPRNSIAVVGLARVSLERGDEPAAWRLAQRALGIDPENVAAQRLAGRLEEVWAHRGESLPDVAAAEVVEAVAARAEAAAAEAGAPPEPVAPPEPMAPPELVASPEPATVPGPVPAPPRARSLADRLLRRNRP
jgi:tetratricopeptide (TPR) repeat protein